VSAMHAAAAARVHLPKAAAATVSAVHAAAAARVQKVLGSVKEQEAAEPRASFFLHARTCKPAR